MPAAERSPGGGGGRHGAMCWGPRQDICDTLSPGPSHRQCGQQGPPAAVPLTPAQPRVRVPAGPPPLSTYTFSPSSAWGVTPDSRPAAHIRSAWTSTQARLGQVAPGRGRGTGRPVAQRRTSTECPGPAAGAGWRLRHYSRHQRGQPRSLGRGQRPGGRQGEASSECVSDHASEPRGGHRRREDSRNGGCC